MCGIAGFMGNDPIEESNVLRCLQSMRRRGPDAAQEKHFVTPTGEHLYLLHSRLSILDLADRANQPFQSGPLWLTYNGELYNFVELRTELERLGHQFKTQSDTEVLLKVLETFGPEGLDRCEGMWAFALYNEKDGSLILSRDRFGEKPLYFHETPQGLFFGSEIKFILALLGHKLPVNTDVLLRYIVNGYKAVYKKESSFIRGIRELPSATWMKLEGCLPTAPVSYWRLKFEPIEMSYEEALDGVRSRLLKALEIRLRADVPLAFCMSGGVDSNSLISIAKRVFDYDVHGFTIIDSDSRYAESEFVDYSVTELGIRHTKVHTEVQDFLPRLRTLIRYHDAPVCTISYFAHWLLMESIAKHGYRISISGTAADELFSGYYDHHLAYLYEIRGLPALHDCSLKAWQQHVQPLVRNPFLSNPDLFVENPDFRNHVYLDAREFAGYLNQPWFEPFDEIKYSPDLMRNRMLNELFHEAVPVILHEDDLNSMYYSIENRSPFLDRHLSEFCYSVPTRHLMRDGLTKALLRDSMIGVAPERVLTNRHKIGFNAALHSFLDTQHPEVKGYLLDDSPIFEHVKRPMIEEILKKSYLPDSENKFLFYFLSSKIFLEEFSR